MSKLSIVVPCYNEELAIPIFYDETKKCLKQLVGKIVDQAEFIFVDDVSKDKSVEIIREATKGMDNITIVAKTQNDGTSKTVNQGIELAKGKWIRMLDSDDILPLDSTKIMLDLAQKHGADMVYGKFVKTGKEPEEIAREMVVGPIEYEYSKDALRRVLKGGFTRMGQLIKADVLKKGQGADPLVFIQDESIPLRASLNSWGG